MIEKEQENFKDLSENKIESPLNNSDRKGNEFSISRKDKIDILIKCITVIITAVSAFIAVGTFLRAEKWKVSEFMSSKLTEYSQNKTIKSVNQILDYNSSTLTIDPMGSFEVNDDFLEEALVLDTIRSDFTIDELKIRNLFDEYFDKQSEFNRYIDLEVFDACKLKPYLEYHIKIIADTSDHKKNIDLKRRLWSYINYYGYKDVVELYKKMGYDIETKN